MRNSIKEYTTKVILDTGGQHLSDQMYVWSFMTVYNFEKKRQTCPLKRYDVRHPQAQDFCD